MNKAIVGCAIVVGVTVFAGLKARIQKSKQILAEKPVSRLTPDQVRDITMQNIRDKYPSEVADVFEGVHMSLKGTSNLRGRN